ncbi:hypothetical protein CHARACLAT_000127 [Characodon lateralis]|uniref:E3 ubiquitin-protein ligase n=1 Tax=Characodon lateralis TaxID=208331 RepID=A0ABU7CMF0_9TELE|nr:hypothetical protein [Characodon lateralis]
MALVCSLAAAVDTKPAIIVESLVFDFLCMNERRSGSINRCYITHSFDLFLHLSLALHLCPIPPHPDPFPPHLTPAPGMASILMSAVGVGVHFTSAPLSQQQPLQQHQQQPAPFALPPPPPLLPTASRPHSSSSSTVRRAKRQHRRASAQRSEDVIQRYMEVVAEVPEEDCIICMDQLSNPSSYDMPSSEEAGQSILPETVGKFIKCGHTLHMLCMLAMYNNGTKDGSLQCPSCKTIYGEKTGTQPKGKMEIYSVAQSLPGHPDCGTIQIIYSIPPGIQGPEHPNPGQPYTCRGFPRFCFLPDNDKGRKVLELLKVAWMRRLIFTVGTSSTTGEQDTVVWNGIHHKTEMMSNLSGHGYPDPNYLENVLSELASQGVTEDCLKPPGSSCSS